MSAQFTDFSLTGKTADIEDGTYLFFRDLVNGGDIDSAMVQNNSFKFTTELPEPTYYVMLFTKDKQKFTELWLENKPMTFDSSIAGFEEAEVTGSVNHSLYRIKRAQVLRDAELPEMERHQKTLDFIKEHPDALVSAYLVYGNRNLKPHEERNLFSSLSQEVQNSSLGKRIALRLEKDLPSIGDNFIDFSLSNSKGENSKISDLKGKLTLLQFWSSSCGASRLMNADLTGLYETHHPQGLEIISISRDKREENWFRAIEEDNFLWSPDYNLIDPEMRVFNSYGISGTPSNFLINSEGVIIARNLRGDDLERKIKEELVD